MMEEGNGLTVITNQQYLLLFNQAFWLLGAGFFLVASTIFFALRNRQLKQKLEESGEDTAGLVDILNGLPFPVWRRNDHLEIRFRNTNFKEQIESYSTNTTLAKRAKETKAMQSEQLVSGLTGNELTFKIHEIPTESGTIGFAYEISNPEEE